MFLFLNNTLDDLDNTIDTRNHIAGPKSNNSKGISLKPRCPTFVVNHLLRLKMLIAINFNHKPDRQTYEIREVWTQGKLTTKAMATNRLSPQVMPEFLLST